MRSEKGKIDDIAFWVKNIIYRQIMTIVEDVESIPKHKKLFCQYNLMQVLLLQFIVYSTNTKDQGK